MQTSVTPLTARSQTMVSILLGIMAVMGVSPVFEVLAIRWPMRFGEVPWRYDTFVMLLANGPQLVILIGIIAVVGTLTGYRAAVRGAAIAFGVVVFLHAILLPLFVLDFFQTRRLVAQARSIVYKAVALKTLVFGMIVTVAAAWSAMRAWQSSIREGAGGRRQKGEGLVVGQPKPPRPPT